MTLFLITFAIIAVVITLMSVGVIFGRDAIKGTCGGVNNGGECICTQKCEKRRKLEAMAAQNQ
ncbi:(Na+)-NQR maturation NqrM [Methylomagnum sp.]